MIIQIGVIFYLTSCLLYFKYANIKVTKEKVNFKEKVKKVFIFLLLVVLLLGACFSDGQQKGILGVILTAICFPVGIIFAIAKRFK